MDVPKNFQPIAELRTSPFLERIGPLFFEWRGKKLVLGDQEYLFAVLRDGPARYALVLTDLTLPKGVSEPGMSK